MNAGDSPHVRERVLAGWTRGLVEGGVGFRRLVADPFFFHVLVSLVS